MNVLYSFHLCASLAAQHASDEVMKTHRDYFPEGFNGFGNANAGGPFSSRGLSSQRALRQGPVKQVAPRGIVNFAIATLEKENISPRSPKPWIKPWLEPRSAPHPGGHDENFLSLSDDARFHLASDSGRP